MGRMQDPLIITGKRKSRTHGGDSSPGLIGRKLGSYQVLALLGAGGMGEVYRARDTRLNRTVALKVLNADRALNREATSRFTREAKAASALNHPNICTIYEIGDSQGIRFIAMEHVEGTVLSDWAAEKQRDITSILDIGTHLADALDEAHGKGVIHRDIKPGNLIVTPRGVVKILDFGLAKIRPSEDQGVNSGAATSTPTQQGVVLGTVDYMSPEQVLGQQLDARTDIFSLGAVLYELVSGHRPFTGSAATQTMANILHAEPEPLPLDVPSELVRIIRKCLEKDRELRYQSAGDLLLDLSRLKRAIDSGAYPAFSKRGLGTAATWGIVLSSIALMGALIYWLVFLGSDRQGGSEAPLAFVPLTSYAGSESFPSFSPDGTLIAFDWDGEKQANKDIYIKQLDSDGYSRLTDHEGWDSDAAWSPDGRSIAFIRETGSGEYAVVLKPPLGGRERAIAEVRFQLYLLWNRNVAWHPGGKWLVVPDSGVKAGPAGLFLISVESGEKRRLTEPPPDFAGDSGPAFSPDGRSLAFARYVSENVSDVHLLSLDDQLAALSEPVPVTSDHRSYGPEWARDGKEIFYVSGSRHSPALWRLDPRNPANRRPLPGMHRSFGPAFSPDGNRLAFAQLLTDVNIWQIEVGDSGSPRSSPVNLISSTYVDHTPQFSPDGSMIAFSSYRSGSPEIWVCRADGSGAFQLTSFRGPETDLPAWSPDGKTIVFGSRAAGSDDIYFVPARGGQVRKLTDDSSDDKGPSYSRDGRWIYFSSNRSGERQIWKMPAGGGTPVQVTRNGGILPAESVDRRDIYYVKETSGHYFSSLWRMPVEGGEETKVLNTVYGNDYALASGGIYFIPHPSPDWSIDFFSFETQKTKRFAPLAKRAAWGFSMSSDERRFLYAQFDTEGFDLVLVEETR